MEDVLNNPTVGDNQAKIDAAFGTNPNLKMDRVKEVVQNLKTKDMPIKSANPTIAGAAHVTYNLDASNKVVPGANGNIMKEAEIGKPFYNHLGKDDQAGYLIHEAVHYQSHGGDNVDKRPGTKDRILTTDQHSVPAKDLKVGGGCE